MHTEKAHDKNPTYLHDKHPRGIFGSRGNICQCNKGPGKPIASDIFNGEKLETILLKLGMREDCSPH